MGNAALTSAETKDAAHCQPVNYCGTRIPDANAKWNLYRAEEIEDSHEAPL